MSEKSISNKGPVLEESLRAFFLRAGFFVIRGVPFRFADEDLTDVDLWLYECPTGTARRVQICDIKYKQRPKAVERIFWTRGVAEALDVDGAYVATTDKRKSLRSIASKLNIQLIDGTDVQRIISSKTANYPERISDEDLIQELQLADKEFRGKVLQEARIDILSSVSDGFGAPSAVRALEGFSTLARRVVTCHPNSKFSRAAGRLTYLAAAIVCASLDYISVGAVFRTFEERREHLLNAVRYGALSDEGGMQQLKLAIALIEQYSPGGKAAATAMEKNLKDGFEKIPAEIIADQAMKLLKVNQLFPVGREIEMACYQSGLPNFDNLSSAAKSMLGALLDYADVSRERFAKAWEAQVTYSQSNPEAINESQNAQEGLVQPTLFGEGA